MSTSTKSLLGKRDNDSGTGGEDVCAEAPNPILEEQEQDEIDVLTQRGEGIRGLAYHGRGKVGADTVEGVLHLQQGLAAAAWDPPVNVVSLLDLCVHGQERCLTPRPSSDADDWHIEPRRRCCS
jgi:hypothetical protein